MADYKILQNIDLAQNEIKEVSKISNDRTDGKDKGLRIQTGDSTSLTFSREEGDTSNFIEGIAKEEISNGNINESIFIVTPSEISISNKSDVIPDADYVTSRLTLGLNASKEHIEAVSPLITLKTGVEEYIDPFISLEKETSTLGLKSNKIKAFSEKDSKSSSLTMEDTIVGISQGITFKTEDLNPNVSLDLNTNGVISLEAVDSITESVGKLSVSLDTFEEKATQAITIKNSEEENPSQIEVYDKGVKASKDIDSYVDLRKNSLEEQSSTITIKTPTNVTLELNDTDKSVTLDSKGIITLTSNKGTSNKEASTIYGNNSIKSKADFIKLQTQGYEEEAEDTSYFPHIELISDTNSNSVLVEGKTLEISSKDEGSNNEDIISLSGSKLNIKNNITEVTSEGIKVQHKESVTRDTESKEEEVLTLEIVNKADSKLIKVPSTTVVDISSDIMGLGGTESTTTISGSTLNIDANSTNITSTSILNGDTTLQSSSVSNPEDTNTLKVSTSSTSITGKQTDFKSNTINIGTDTTTSISIGRNAEGTTTLQSQETEIASSTLKVTSPIVKFGEGIKQTLSFNGTGTVISNVDTSVVDKTFSVKSGSTEVLKADTTSISLAGTSTSIKSQIVSIGADTTTSIAIGRNAEGTTTLQSQETEIASPTINIGTETTTSLEIGNNSADKVNLRGNSNSDLSITSDTTTSTVKAKNLNFTENLVGNNIKIYWDTDLSSLVFARE